MRLILALFAVVVLCGCRASTDLTKLGVGAGATWKDGPKVGLDVGAGKHEVEVAPLFPAAGDAAEGAPGSCPDGKCGVPAAPAIPGAAPAGFCPN